MFPGHGSPQGGGHQSGRMQPVPLETGDFLPDFQLPNQRGNVTVLSRKSLGKPVVILFHPDHRNPGAQQILRGFARLHADFAAHAHIFVVNNETPEANRQAIARDGLPFDFVLSDEGRRVAATYGVAHNLSGPQDVFAQGLFTTVVADSNRRILRVDRGVTDPGHAEAVLAFLASLSDYTSFGYNAIYFVMVVAFTYLYTAIIINPQQMADDLKRNNAFIPGIKPGTDTANFIGMVLDRITLPGAIFLAVIGILPGIAALFGVTQGFAQFYGGTSMLIAVQVILDTLQQIESHLLMRHYDGLTETGRIGGRQPKTSPTQVVNG